MESGSAEGSAPTTPASATATASHHIAPTSEPIDSASKASSKQRQRTRRACYPCSKVCLSPRGSLYPFTNILCNRERSNVTETNVPPAPTAQKDRMLNSAPLTMTVRDLLAPGIRATLPLLLLAI